MKASEFTSPSYLRTIRCALAAAFFVYIGGCSLQSRSRLVPETQKNIAVTHDQFRLRMRALVDPMCGQIEQCADSVMTDTKDRKVQAAMLTWQIEAVPAIREALYQPDPLTAGVDTLTLCYQMASYFETGGGKKALGPASTQPAQTCRQMASQIEQALISTTISGEIPRIQAFATKWAAEHPIEDSISGRQSVLARMTEYHSTDGLSAGETVAELSTTLDDLNRKLGVYSDQLFRQARWEMERFKLELFRQTQINQAVPLAERGVQSAEQAAGTIERLTPQLERSLDVIPSLPKLVALERKTALDSVHDDVSRALAAAHDERVAAMEQIAKERAIALGVVNDMVIQQRKLMVAEADRITVSGIDYALRQVARLLALGVATLVMVLGGALLLRWHLVRGRADKDIHRIASPVADTTRIGLDPRHLVEVIDKLGQTHKTRI